MSTAANPKANQLHPSDAPQEPTGAIASDSLAAESIKAGGEFAQNDNAAISSVKGANSTLNNTDTSGATVLPAAQDGTERAREEAKGLGADEKGVTGAKYPETIGQPEFSGTHSQEGYVGGASTTGGASSTSGGSSLPSGATGDSFADGAAPTSSSTDADSKISSGSSVPKASGTSSSSGSSGPSSGTGARATGGGSGTSADDAPNYAATVSGAIRPEGEDKPKGENLTEGGIPQTKTFTGDVGGVHDPGRLAEKGFTKVGPGNAASAGEASASSGAQGGEGSGPAITGGQYDVLESERA